MPINVPFLEASESVLYKSKNDLTLVHYKANSDDRYLDGVKNYRAVVYGPTKKVVAFTPPKMVLFEKFADDVPLERASFREYMDGTMVYAFHFDGEWRFGTRCKLDADTTYRCGMAPVEGVAEVSPPAMVPKLNELFKPEMDALLGKMEVGNTYVFSFLHPQAFNTIKGSGLYLVAVYRCTDGETVESVPLPEGFLTPPVLKVGSYSDLPAYIANSPSTFKGVVMTDPETGVSAKLITPKFVYVHKLWIYPSVNRTLVYWYRSNTNKLNELLAAYPEYEINLTKIKNALTAYGKYLYECYVDCFINKKKLLREYKRTTRHNLYTLHGIYLHDLRVENKKMNRMVVYNYVDNLSPDDAMSLF